MKNNLSPLWLSFLCGLLLIWSCSSTKEVDLEPTRIESKVEKAGPEMLTTAPMPANRSNPNSLLWEITGNGLTTPSYLFGTIHLIGEKDFFMTDLMKDRFNRTLQLTLEIDMDDPSTMVSAATGAFMKDGVTLKSLLSDTDYKKLSTYIEDSLGLNIALFNNMKPIFVSTMITQQGMMDDVVSYENVFMEMAKDRNMEVKGLETVEFQMSMFDSISYQSQANMLMDGLEGSGDMSMDVFDEMVENYKDQNIPNLHKLITEESSEFKDFGTLLLDKRNQNWIPVIKKMAKEKPTFFAVGAGHLGGPQGVIQLLKNEGYTLTPLREK